MLISIKISRNSAFIGSDKHRKLFFPLINVKMPTIVSSCQGEGVVRVSLGPVKHV